MRLLVAVTVAALTAASLALAPGDTAPAPGEAAPAPGRAAPPDRYVVPGDRAFPTGLAMDPTSGHFYVGSAEDGTLYRGHLSEPAVEVWSPAGQDGRTFTSGMNIDPAGRLFAGGGATGTLRIYDTGSKALLARLKGRTGGFVNDIALAGDGTAYVTDSFKPQIYRVTRAPGGRWAMRPWLDVEAAGVEWIHGQHNLNGIVAVGSRLLAVQSNTGRLWRIDPATREVVEVDLDGENLPGGDGLAWRDGRLYVSQGDLFEGPGAQSRVAVVEMSEDLSRGRVVDGLAPPEGLLHPSAVALTSRAVDGAADGAGAAGRVLVVNSQFNRWSAGLPPQSLPFTVSSLPLPARPSDRAARSTR
ncbi:SMP-30/gluconolactonase/LRE family protein [Streptomyces sp. NPDC017546]|uniref:SMP-30/gluconolactonase/LRE family protein n=1 Tax=unclassified Streptomyces TaxID=2593676 RepID=UPI00236121CF|nr:hypothetical protein [Streptomyces sp. MMBL 11-1]